MAKVLLLLVVGTLITLGLTAFLVPQSVGGAVGLGAGFRNGLVISTTIGESPSSAAQKAAEDANGGGLALGGAVSGNTSATGKSDDSAATTKCTMKEIRLPVVEKNVRGWSC